MPSSASTSTPANATFPYTTLFRSRKDVDGFHPENIAKLALGDPTGLVPCTPLGVQRLLIESKIDISGAHVVILGRSMIVGKPVALLDRKSTRLNSSH